MEHQRISSLLIALLAMLALVQGPRLLTNVASQAASEEEREKGLAPPAPTMAVTEEKPAEEQTARPGWKEPLRLYREFLGLPPEARPGTPADVNAVFAQACMGRYRLESIVALVPDPVDSNLAANFDQAIEAIQTAGADSGYLLDRLWLPWTGDDAQSKLYREAPGILLFRNRKLTDEKGQQDSRLLAVYLVGETPKQGIHKRAFGAALELASRLTTFSPAPSSPTPTFEVCPPPRPVIAAPVQPPQVLPQPASAEPRIRILGPSLSGSMPSLRSSLENWRDGAKAAEEPSVSFQVVTGSATAQGLEEQLAGIASFERTVLPDDELQRCAFDFLVKELGWDRDKIALLAESDTGYGRPPESDTADGRQKESPAMLTVRFPSGLASLRSAWEKDEEAESEARAKGEKVAVPRGSLALSLADKSRPVDIVPQFSDLSVAAHDLVLSNLLDSIWRGGIRYVGILSTDVRDKLFLAERIRLFAPDMVVFTLDNNLLYAHPQYSAALDGTLVLTSFPLYPENQRWRETFAGPAGLYRRQFASEFQQGIFLAAGKLIDGRAPQPRGWIAAVGNGTLWPIASFPETLVGYEDLAGRGDLQLLLITALLCLLALWLRAVYPPAEIYAGTNEVDLTARRLLAFGNSVLAALGGVIAVLGTLPFWASRSWGLRSVGWDRLFESLYLAGLAAGYFFLVWSAARATVPPHALAGAARRRGRVHWLAWALGGVVLLLGLAVALPWSWMPGGAEFFYLRGRKLTSGLSPVIPLLLLGGSFYFWVLMELKRRRLIARQAIEWPLRWRLDPPLEGVQAIVAPIYALMHRTFPARPWGKPPSNSPVSRRLASQGRWFWIALLVLLVPPAIMLMRIVQPICEPRGYGRLFLLICLFAFCLAAVSFFQFFALWLDLDRMLQRLDHTRLTAAFRRISSLVAWSPMRAFGWSPPNFKMITVTAERLRPLLYKPGQQVLFEHLETLFRADQAGDLATETRARTELERLFAAATEKLAQYNALPEVEEFFAVRIVAFLRPVVAHMRNCLTAALLASLALLFAVRCYAFEPQWFVSVGIWVALGIGVVVTLWVFVQMDRNASLSAIGGTDPGKVSFDRHFLVNVLTYGVIPLAGIAVTQFPQVGRFVTGWLNPVLRVAGIG